MASGNIAVVGAGLAGLSASQELKRRGYEVDLFERSRLVGGKATSFRAGEVEVDNGQHVYLACCTELIDFMEQIGAGRNGNLYMQPRFDALLLARGRKPARLRAVRLPAPWHLAPALLRYHHLSPRARLLVGLALISARRPAHPGETFAAWLERRHQGRASIRAFWEPFMVPALNAPLDQVSAEDALFVLRAAFLNNADAARFGFARVPLGRLAEAAARNIDRVHMRTPVTGLDVEIDVQGRTKVRGLVLNRRDPVRFDAVILAVPPDRLKRILGDPRQFGIQDLDSFHCAPIVDVHLWYDTPSVGFGFAALVGSPVQWIFEKAPGYLCCSMSAADEYVSWPAQDLVNLCHREVSAVLPSLVGALRSGTATRDREATFIPTPGLRRPGPRTAVSNLVIAGAWTDTGWPATMESAVISGRKAVRELIESGGIAS